MSPRSASPASPSSPVERSGIVVYAPDSSTSLEVRTDGETVWLTQDQMCRLSGRNQSVIARHIANVFREGELPKEGFMQILHKTSTEGGRPVAIYNLDVIISVGYRVKSFRGTLFRQWATRTLREMLLNRLDEIKRISSLERRMDHAETGLKNVEQGVAYLVKQLSSPPPSPPKPKIGFQARR